MSFAINSSLRRTSGSSSERNFRRALRREWWLRSLATIGSLLCAIGICAQTPVATKHVVVNTIKITQRDPTCPSLEGKKVWVVVSDQDGDPYLAKDEGDGTWTVSTDNARYEVATTHASVRTDTMRTNCLPLESLETAGTRVGLLKLKCNTDPAKLTVITVTPPLHVSYLREPDGGVQCREHGHFHIQGKLFAVREHSENVRLQFNRESADLNDPGLLLSSLLAAQRAGKKLNQAGIAHAYRLQHASDKGSQPSRAASNAEEVKRHVTWITIE